MAEEIEHITPRGVERYVAEIDGSQLTSEPCRCGDCGWTGPGEELEPIGDCGLDPGDPSPAGRCPECGTIAYMDGPRYRIDNQSMAFAKIAARLLYDGALSEIFESLENEARAALKAAGLETADDARAAGLLPALPAPAPTEVRRPDGEHPSTVLFSTTEGFTLWDRRPSAPGYSIPNRFALYTPGGVQIGAFMHPTAGERRAAELAGPDFVEPANNRHRVGMVSPSSISES